MLAKTPNSKLYSKSPPVLSQESSVIKFNSKKTLSKIWIHEIIWFLLFTEIWKGIKKEIFPIVRRLWNQWKKDNNRSTIILNLFVSYTSSYLCRSTIYGIKMNMNTEFWWKNIQVNRPHLLSCVTFIYLYRLSRTRHFYWQFSYFSVRRLTLFYKRFCVDYCRLFYDNRLYMFFENFQLLSFNMLDWNFTQCPELSV